MLNIIILYHILNIAGNAGLELGNVTVYYYMQIHSFIRPWAFNNECNNLTVYQKSSGNNEDTDSRTIIL